MPGRMTSPQILGYTCMCRSHNFRSPSRSQASRKLGEWTDTQVQCIQACSSTCHHTHTFHGRSSFRDKILPTCYSPNHCNSLHTGIEAQSYSPSGMSPGQSSCLDTSTLRLRCRTPVQRSRYCNRTHLPCKCHGRCSFGGTGCTPHHMRRRRNPPRTSTPMASYHFPSRTVHTPHGQSSC